MSLMVNRKDLCFIQTKVAIIQTDHLGNYFDVTKYNRAWPFEVIAGTMEQFFKCLKTECITVIEYYSFV